MNLHWQGSIEVAAPVERVYGYLADFPRHVEWARSLEHLEKIREGDAAGLGARYVAQERIDFPGKSLRRHLRGNSTARTVCEVRELRPNRRIAWHARPIPHIGDADLRFDLAPSQDGGTIVTQTVDEHYPLPSALLLRLVYHVTEDGIRRQLRRGLGTLKTVLDSGEWQATPRRASDDPPQSSGAEKSGIAG